MLTGFTAYNGLFSSSETHEHTTFYSDIGGADSSGALKDIETGEETLARVTTSAIGVNFGGNGAQPAARTDADDIFSGFVDFSAGSTRSVEISGGDAYQYTFENLDSGATYEFAGTAVRGNSGYTNRWTLVEIGGAESFTSAHSTGSGVITSGLQPNQVAIWTGDNSSSGQGYVAQWKDIDAGADGIFYVSSTQYSGSVPTSIHSSGRADGNKGYGIAGIRLIENVPAGPPAVENVAASQVLAFEAEVGGNVLTTGGQVPDVKLFYGTTDGGTNQAAWQNSVDVGPTSRSFSTTLDGLTQGTRYFYRAFAENTLGNDWADTTSSFTTLTASAPTIQLRPAENVGAFAAVVGGEVVDTGNDTPIVTLYYGDNDAGTNAGAWDHSIDIGVQSGAFATSLSGLQPLSQYYFRARAQNAIGQRWASSTLSFTTTDAPPLQINEFMSDNATVLNTRTRADVSQSFRGDRLTPDWIEIHNPTDQATDLGGFHLTDDRGEPKKWEFPAGSRIAAGGYLVVFASGLDIRDARLDERGYLHTNFQLGGDRGDDLVLSDARGDTVYELRNSPLQSEDISYGLDTAGNERFFVVATPGSDNANDTPASPVISVSSKTFTDSIVVELTPALPSHSIRYTVNERTPTASSTLYTGPITVSSTTQLRAVSVAPNGKTSAVVSETYVELASSVLNASSNLPYLIVDTFGDGVDRSSFSDAFIAIIEPGEDGRTRLTDEFDLKTRGGIHVRGSSSAGFSKKQYRVEFWDEQNEDQKHKVLGLPKEADWIFYGPNQFDRVLISNPLMFDLSNQIGRYATRTRYVEMYLNSSGTVGSSDYVGVYAITEVIEQGDDRVDVETLTTGAGGVPVEGGFIWKNDRGSAYVDPERTTSAQRRYIDGWIRDLERAAASRDFKDPDVGYERYADVDSFIDHNILNLLAMNVDALRLSSFYYKSADGKLEAGPIWDFDRSLDSTDGRDNNPRTWFGTGDSTRYFNDNDRVMSWWPDMFNDPDFVQRYIDRWFELRQDEFSLENINATIDAHAAEISEAAARDYRRWSRSRYGDFQGEIDHLKTWLRRRVEWIDSKWLDAPTFDVQNAHVDPGTPVNLQSSTGQVYYTLDGTDPRGEDGVVRPEARLANGPIFVNGLTQITARVHKPNHGGSNGYVRSGDDWSAPTVAYYFNETPADASNFAITEVQYNPPTPSVSEEAAGFDDNDDFEFIELVNRGNDNIVLTGAKLQRVDVDGDSEGVDFDFSNSSISTLAPGERVVVVENREAFEARYGDDVRIAGQWSGGLNNNRELLTLVAYDGSVIQQFSYNDNGLWPERADGKGSSLVINDTTEDYNDPRSWRASVRWAGSPGAESEAAMGVVVNEVLAHTDAPLSDSIELHNTTSQSIDMSGWFLSDSGEEPLKYQLPQGTVLDAGGYLVFDEADFNPTPNNPGNNDFALSGSRGDEVWLVVPDENGAVRYYADTVEFPATLNGESVGRVPNGTGELAPMSQRTLGSENSAPRVGPVVISELNYNPGEPSFFAKAFYPEMSPDDLEFVEIFNPLGFSIDLTEWRVRGGVDYNFDSGTQLHSGDTLLLLSFDPQKPENEDRLKAFRTHYGLGESVPLVGGYAGQLNDSGESVRLQRPDDPPLDNPTLIPRLLEDEVRYDDASPWPAAAGSGQSLTRVAADAYGSTAASWRAADPSPGTSDLMSSDVNGDVNDDGVVDADDIDLVCGGIGSANTQLDLNGDGAVTSDDVELLVEGVLRTSAGDSNADGVFNSSDLIQVFNRGEYEDGIAGNSRWSDGDWNCDGDFTSADLIAAFQADTYVRATPASRHAAAVLGHNTMNESTERLATTEKDDAPSASPQTEKPSELTLEAHDSIFDELSSTPQRKPSNILDDAEETLGGV